MAEPINTSHVSKVVKCYFASTSSFSDYSNSSLETENSDFYASYFLIPDSNIEKYVYEMRSSKLWRNFLYVTQMQLDFEGNIKLHFLNRCRKQCEIIPTKF